MGENTIIIPAYQPDEKLISLIQELTEYGFDDIVVVNDGSKKSVSLFSKR